LQKSNIDFDAVPFRQILI